MEVSLHNSCNPEVVQKVSLLLSLFFFTLLFTLLLLSSLPSFFHSLPSSLLLSIVKLGSVFRYREIPLVCVQSLVQHPKFREGLSVGPKGSMTDLLACWDGVKEINVLPLQLGRVKPQLYLLVQFHESCLELRSFVVIYLRQRTKIVLNCSVSPSHRNPNRRISVVSPCENFGPSPRRTLAWCHLPVRESVSDTWPWVILNICHVKDSRTETSVLRYYVQHDRLSLIFLFFRKEES